MKAALPLLILVLAALPSRADDKPADFEAHTFTWHGGAKLPYRLLKPSSVEPGKKYFVNVGAVGQPRDGNPKAGYVVYDLNEGTIELRRLDYDIPKAQKKIMEAGLPQRLADRLALGK